MTHVHDLPMAIDVSFGLKSHHSSSWSVSSSDPSKLSDAIAVYLNAVCSLTCSLVVTHMVCRTASELGMVSLQATALVNEAAGHTESISSWTENVFLVHEVEMTDTSLKVTGSFLTTHVWVTDSSFLKWGIALPLETLSWIGAPRTDQATAPERLSAFLLRHASLGSVVYKSKTSFLRVHLLSSLICCMTVTVFLMMAVYLTLIASCSKSNFLTAHVSKMQSASSMVNAFASTYACPRPTGSSKPGALLTMNSTLTSKVSLVHDSSKMLGMCRLLPLWRETVQLTSLRKHLWHDCVLSAPPAQIRPFPKCVAGWHSVSHVVHPEPSSSLRRLRPLLAPLCHRAWRAMSADFAEAMCHY